ncbi:hypothetical protein A5784_16790 [Mycobacterium sp. 852013-50091_SCH5140682]|nr:hypothetical protein A5784_16790 [Mycobacterium sp. 852013-50091_SCH5140682]
MSTSQRDCDRQVAEALRAEVTSLRRQLARRSRLLDAVVGATVWDQAVYDNRTDPRWLQIDRDDWAEILRASSLVDSWRPWAASGPVK